MIILNKMNETEINDIIFDIDGTITRWKNVPDFLKKSLGELGIPYSDKSLEGLYKAMEYREIHAMLTGEANEDAYSMLLGSYIPDLHKHDKTGKDLKEVMFELEPSETYISEEVPEVLDKLSEKYNLYCYTNWFKKQAIKKLDRYNLTKYFKAVHSSEDTYIKFTKLGFIWLINKYGLNPMDVVHIGDSRNDIISSKKASIHPIYLDYSITSDITKKQMYLITQAEASITEFKDIEKILYKK